MNDERNTLRDSSRFFFAERGGRYFGFDRVTNSFFELARATVESLSGSPEPIAAADAGFLRDLAAVSDAPPASPLRRRRMTCIKLDVSTSCNLACRYCFRNRQSGMETADETATEAIDLLVRDWGAEADSYVICFNLAAEPLLQPELLEKIHRHASGVEKRTGKPVEIFFITNGVVSDAKILELVRKIRKGRYVSISIDGPEAVHDANRFHSDGRGSHAMTTATIRWFQRKGIPVAAETTLTAAHPFPWETAQYLLSLGMVKINMKPVRHNTPVSFTLPSVMLLEQGYEAYFDALTAKILGGDISLWKTLKDDYALRPLQKLLFAPPSDRRCFWGIDNVAMDPVGDLYPCDAVLGDLRFRVGNIRSGLDQEAFFADLGVDQRTPCAGCWARYLCGGTCHVNSFFATGDIMGIDPVECHLNKYLAERCLFFIYDLLCSGIQEGVIRAMARSVYG